MLKALAFGFAVGAGIQAWRAWPPNSSVGPEPMAVVFAVGLLAAFFAGRWSGRGHATATATATAVAESTSVATNSVNVALLVPGTGAGQTPTTVAVPTEAASWFASPTITPELTADQLEGMDLTELTEQDQLETRD